MIDLFGNDTPLNDQPKTLTILERFHKQAHYRKSYDKAILCKFCKNVCTNDFASRYYKCKLLGTSHSYATDIRAWNVCDFFDYDNKEIL